MSEGTEEGFVVARESKIADTVNIETIEYRRMRVWRAGPGSCKNWHDSHATASPGSNCNFLAKGRIA